MSHIECIAIDDEPIALSIISNFCERKGGLTLSTFCEPEVGLNEILQKRPDLVFLDIEMNGLNGLDIAQSLPQECCFIFTTAYLKYAIDGYDLDAVDYLHKPFSFSRFQVAVSKALRRIGRIHIKTTSQCIVVKQEYNSVSIAIDDILYVEAVEGYSKIYRASGKYVMSRILLKNMLAMLPADAFVRIHRSFVVSKTKIKSFSRQEVTLNNGQVLPVGRQYATDLISVMNAGH